MVDSSQERSDVQVHSLVLPFFCVILRKVTNSPGDVLAWLYAEQPTLLRAMSVCPVSCCTDNQPRADSATISSTIALSPSLNPLKFYQRPILPLQAHVDCYMCHSTTRVHSELDPETRLNYFRDVFEDHKDEPEITRLVLQAPSQLKLALPTPGQPKPTRVSVRG